MVAARYLFTLLVVCVGLVLSLAMGGLTMALGRMEDWGGFLMAASVAAGAGLLLNAVMLPVLYKVGPEKARIAMLAIMGGFSAGGLFGPSGDGTSGPAGAAGIHSRGGSPPCPPWAPAGGGGAHPGGAVPAVLRHFLLYF